MASSQGTQRKQKISKETCPQENRVKLDGNVGGPSAPSAQTKAPPHEGTHSDLMEQILSRNNMLRALEKLERKKKKAAGIDGMTVEQLRPFLQENWGEIRRQLSGETYMPSPVRRVELQKPDGGKRLLGIPTVLDRLIQQAILQVLTPIFDPEFSEESYGFRPGRSAHGAVRKAREYIKEGYRWVVDIDLEKFFDRVNHDKLMARVARKVGDRRVLRLIRKYLNSGVLLNGVVVTDEEGVSQGGPLSPLLANIMLDDLDKELSRRGHRFVRYADAANIYVRSKRAGERVMQNVTRFLQEELKLKVNEAKSAVDRPWKRKFLGFSYLAGKESRIRISPKSIKRFKDLVRVITSRTRSKSLKDRLEELNSYLVGWLGYYALTEAPSILKGLDSWIRSRLRMCLWKQWKRPSARIRNLRALGIQYQNAYEVGNSRKGYWRMAHCPQMHKALDNAYWQRQELIGLSKR